MARGRYKQRKGAAERLARTDAQSQDNPNEPAQVAPAESDEVASLPIGDGSSFWRAEPLERAAPSRSAKASAAIPIKRQPLASWQQKTAEQSGLRRLGDLSKSLVKLHREEAKLLRERDALIAELRTRGVPWSSLAMRTGLSRQALSKRIIASEHA